MAISLPTPLRLLLLAAVTAQITSATPYILKRADTCAANGLEACPKNLPSSICCPANSSCQALAGDTTVLCCPNGRSCSNISPITCDLGLQDPKTNPKAPIKTTVFDVKLKSCGSGTCCPYGYTCGDEKGQPQCFLDKDQSKTPKEMEDGDKKPTSSATSSTNEPTSTSTQPAASATTSAAAAKDDSESNSHPKLVSIIGGIIGACLVLLIIVTIVLMYIRRRRRNQVVNEKSTFARNKPSGTPYGNIISEPIVQPNSYRTDFILKSPSAESSISQQPANPRYSPKTPAQQFAQPPAAQARRSIPNPFNSPTPSSCTETASSRSYPHRNDEKEDGPPRTGRVVNGRLAPIRSMKGSDRRSRRTSTRHVREEPSNETINIFADPIRNKNRPESCHTTFTDMMDDAELGDVHRGNRYVPGATPKI